ncbi:MAG: hypothetical protein AAF755_03305 [Pseudomonadota bacterium]
MIQLRVVGLFYSTEVEYQPGNTVKDVLRAAAMQKGTGKDFSFVPATNSKFNFEGPRSMTVKFDAPFTRGSGARIRRYAAGNYTLAESFANPDGADPEDKAPFYSVWQYYIFDIVNGDHILRNFSNAFVDYDDKQNAVVPENGKVVWRLVNIRRNSDEGLAEPETPDASTQNA